MSNIVLSNAAKLATGLGINGDPQELVATLKATAFKGPATDSQLAALLFVASQYGLNPWVKELYALPDRQNGIVPVVGVDGWSRIINNHPQFDGMDFAQDEESCTCIIYRKDRNHPIKVTEWMAECRRDGVGPWKSHPRRMLRHKAMIQCARLAFGYGGIYDQDEAERIVEASPVKHMGSMERAEPAELPTYSAEQFAKNLPAWRSAIAAGKATADAVIAKASTKGTLTQEQVDAIRAPLNAPAPQQQEPVTDVQPKGAPEAISEQEVGNRLHAAATLDALYEAADLIGEVADPEARARLTAYFEERQFALESA
jgi:hypothetical protein